MFVGTKSPPVEFMAILGMTMPPIHSQFSKGITCWVLLVWVPLLLSYYNLQNLFTVYHYILLSFHSQRHCCEMIQVICTLTLCSVKNPSKALAEIQRTLKPGSSAEALTVFSEFIFLLWRVHTSGGIRFAKIMGLYLFRFGGSRMIWKSLVASWWILGQLKWHPETFFSVPSNECLGSSLGAHLWSPGGHYLFLEHVLSETNPLFATAQRLATPEHVQAADGGLRVCFRTSKLFILWPAHARFSLPCAWTHRFCCYSMASYNICCIFGIFVTRLSSI